MAGLQIPNIAEPRRPNKPLVMRKAGGKLGSVNKNRGREMAVILNVYFRGLETNQQSCAYRVIENDEQALIIKEKMAGTTWKSIIDAQDAIDAIEINLNKGETK